MRITFRQIEEKDFEFLWRLHNAALKDYVAQTWGWNEEWQRRNFAETFSANDGEIIVFDGEDIGFWWTIEKESETLLASIRLLPEYQNKGIGTRLIKDFLGKTEKPVRLQVLKANPARGLYEKLGFVVFDETETHYLMRTQGKI